MGEVRDDAGYNVKLRLHGWVGSALASPGTRGIFGLDEGRVVGSGGAEYRGVAAR